MKRIAAALAMLALSACAANQPFQGMNADQINAAIADKDAAATCTVVNSPWGKGITTWINVNANIVRNGGLKIAADCSVDFTNAAPPVK